MVHTYTYAACLADAQKINWTVEDLIGGDKTLDFSKPFLPESLARVTELEFLTPEEQLVMNQIRGNEYLYVFGLVEEFILPMVLDHTRPDVIDSDSIRTRAFLQFAAEEAKHIDLFKRFYAEFHKGFGTTCDVIGPRKAVADAVLAHSALSVALTTLHIEWMTQRHYLESIRDNQDLDPQFTSLLKHHWQEEAQHAKLDTLMVESLAKNMTSDEIAAGIEGYAKIGGFLDEGLQQQVQLNLSAFQAHTGRELSAAEREQYNTVQGQAIRWTYLGSGMTHEKFLTTIDEIQPGARAAVEEMAPTFC